jgi:hypothetical protein
MDNQLITTSNVDTSLIDASFPFSNMLDDARFKITRFTGSFIIETSNSSLYANDGSDIIIQISTGQYTASQLATEIQTELNAVSSNWTVTYSTSTYRFTVDRSSGTKILRLSSTSNSIWDTLGYTGSVDQTAGVADEQRNHSKEFIEVDLGTNANEVGFFGLVAPPNMTNPISDNATVELLASNLQNWSAPARTITLQSNDFGVYGFLDDENSRYRYWRFELTDRKNINGPTWDFSNIYLGTYTTLANRNVNSGFTKTWIDPSDVSQAGSGATYANIKQRYLQLNSLTINYMDQSDRKKLEQLCYDFGQHKPFWIALDPVEECSTIDELTRYVYFNGNPTFNHFRNSVYSMAFGVRDAL